MGLGLFGGGVELIRYLVRHNAQVTVTDLKDRDGLRESVEALKDLPIRWKLGRHDEEDFRAADMVFASPAVPSDSDYLRIAMAHGIPVETEMNLFFKLCPAPIVGVTGSSGKTTTTCLIGEMLRKVDRRTLVGGNIGGSPLSGLDALSPDIPVVLELSSFQLENLQEVRRSPHIAVVLNLTPDHLDRHGTMEAYIQAKWTIVAYQTEDDIAVLNADDPVLMAWAERCPGQVLSFGLEQGNGQGVFLRAGRMVASMGGQEIPILDARDMVLPGRHNLQNGLAAVCAALTYGVPTEDVARVLRTFKGVEHRLELVRELDGVRYYNDSIATSPDRTLAALSAFQGGIVLIAGGHEKKLPFHRLAEAIVRQVKMLILIGETAGVVAERVHGEDPGGKVEIRCCGSLGKAVQVAHERASTGDVVLLSPAYASYDMFRNFEDRGRQFKEWVRRL